VLAPEFGQRCARHVLQTEAGPLSPGHSLVTFGGTERLSLPCPTVDQAA
jgi:hypothetical protein